MRVDVTKPQRKAGDGLGVVFDERSGPQLTELSRPQEVQQPPRLYSRITEILACLQDEDNHLTVGCRAAVGEARHHRLCSQLNTFLTQDSQDLPIQSIILST